ncbi:acylphosphatase [Lacticigenium naphthae]|uniref:acylphosphatase n=1 Tax=Lacticigenium naphthae TaxID=515351 RepID=UPI0004263AA9|nr:acylphosphatase [Lacticigenium naphthae]
MASLFDKFMKKQNTKNSDHSSTSTIEYLNEPPSDSQEVSIEVRIFGRVQGVGFRYTTKQLADELGVVGRVRNENDGSVYVQGSAKKNIIDKFITELSNSPSPSGRVEHLEVKYIKEQDIKDKDDFRITN